MTVTPITTRSGAIELELRTIGNHKINSVTLSDLDFETFQAMAHISDPVEAFWAFKTEEMAA